MIKEVRTNNLFKYATSELSQDAFICWLFSHLMEENWNKDTELRNCGQEFLKMILGSKGIVWDESMKITDIKKQENSIDVLLIINDWNIIIEDKTFTNSHNDQVVRYKDVLIKKGIKDENIFCVFYKIIEQSYDEEHVDIEFTREMILSILRKYQDKISNPIFQDYLETLEVLDEYVNSYGMLPISEWSGYSYTGFFKHLQKSILAGRSTGWGYVANPTGGFMGFWWFDVLNQEQFKKLGLIDGNKGNLYIQIENNIITIKLSIENIKTCDKDYIYKLRWDIFKKIKKIDNQFDKKNFRFGSAMTIGYINYDESNYEEKLFHMEDVLLKYVEEFKLD